MRGLLTCLAMIVAVLMGVWAYQVGYETRAAERAVAKLEREIGARHRELSMLRAEWAYLNRPDRLRALAEMNFERLALMPLAPDHFATVDQVGYPMAALIEVVAEPLGDDVSEVIIMNHRYGADTRPALIAPPTLADDGEMLP